MSTFQDNMKSDLDDVILNTDELAEEVTYTPYGGSDATVTVVWDDTGVEERYIKDNLRKVAVAVVEISKTDAASPDTRDKFTRGGATWAVNAIQAQDISSSTMEVITFDQRFIGGKRIRGGE